MIKGAAGYLFSCAPQDADLHPDTWTSAPKTQKNNPPSRRLWTPKETGTWTETILFIDNKKKRHKPTTKFDFRRWISVNFPLNGINNKMIITDICVWVGLILAVSCRATATVWTETVQKLEYLSCPVMFLFVFFIGVFLLQMDQD